MDIKPSPPTNGVPATKAPVKIASVQAQQAIQASEQRNT